MKRTKITIETERELIVTRGRPSGVTYVAWCEGCTSLVAMITVDEAAAIASVSSLAVYRQVESGRLHFAETPEGQLFVCTHSLHSEYETGKER